MEFQTRYSYHLREGWTSSVPSMTQQQFKDDADINFIIAQYNSTGVMPTFHGDGSAPQPMFGDFANLPEDAQQAYNQILKARDDFNSLSLDIRKRFNFDPGEFLAFVSNPNNIDEMVAMGLATKTVIKPEQNNNPQNPDINTPDPPKE